MRGAMVAVEMELPLQVGATAAAMKPMGARLDPEVLPTCESTNPSHPPCIDAGMGTRVRPWFSGGDVNPNEPTPKSGACASPATRARSRRQGYDLS